MTIQALDTRLLLLINHRTANDLFDIVMPFLSSRGYLLILPFLIYLFIISGISTDARKRNYLAAAVWTFLIACLAVFLAEWSEYLLKNASGRIRPCRTIDGIRLIIPCPRSFSMPSGHAISSFAFATPLYFLTRDRLNRIIRSYPLLLASFIALSRVYLGVHYPTDVLVGALLGTLIALLLCFLYLWAEKKRYSTGRV